MKSENEINIFSQISYNIGFGENGLGASSKTTGYGLEIGAALFLNNIVGLEFFLSYDKLTNTFDKTDTRNTNQFFVGLGFQIHLER